MIVLALDYGEKRIGMAIGNTLLKTSTPIKSLIYGKNSPIPKINEVINDYEVVLLILGYPLNMDGTESPFSGKVKKFGKLLARETGLEVKLVDERLTSFEAEEMLKSIENDYKKRKKSIDSVSAHIILSEYLETL